MALTLQDVEKAEKQARLQRRMALATNAENNANNRSADLNQAAHDRFMQRRRNFLERNPNAVSPIEYAATMGFERGKNPTGLRQHELDVLKQQGENAIGVEREKAEGLKNQGLSAAEKNLEAAKYGADKNLEIEQERQRGMTEREKSIAEGNLNVEKERRAGALDLERARQRGALSIAQEQSGAAVDVQVEKNKGLQTQAELERNAKEFEMQHKKELTQMRINGQLPNRQEMNLLYQLQQKPENKDKSIAELLDQIRGTSRY